MLKDPFEALKFFTKEKVDRDRKTNEFIYTQSDSLITWLVGFSFTGLTLLALNINSLSTNLKGNLKPIVVCFALTIIIGLAFRYVSYLMMIFQKSLDDYFAGLFSDFDMMPIEPDDDTDACDFNTIMRRLKEDFDEQIPFPRELSDAEKELELPKLIKHYKALCEHARKKFDIGINHIAEINETAYKIDKNKSLEYFSKEMTHPRIGYNLRRWQKVRGWLYILTILPFIVSILIFTIYLMKV